MKQVIFIFQIMILFYRILTYLLIPFVSLVALSGLMMLPVALSNPALLLPVFIVVAMVIYYVNSFRFLHSGLLERRPLAVRLRDWIRVNAFVALFIPVQSAALLFLLMSNSPQLAEVLQAARDMQTQQALPANVSIEKTMLTMLWSFAIAGLLMGVHILLSLWLVRRYTTLFAR